MRPVSCTVSTVARKNQDIITIIFKPYKDLPHLISKALFKYNKESNKVNIKFNPITFCQ